MPIIRKPLSIAESHNYSLPHAFIYERVDFRKVEFSKDDVIITAITVFKKKRAARSSYKCSQFLLKQPDSSSIIHLTFNNLVDCQECC